MKKETKALFLSTALTAALLNGCTKDDKVVKDGSTYVYNGQEYVQVDDNYDQNQVQLQDMYLDFEPGTHYIQYYVPMVLSENSTDSNYFGSNEFYFDTSVSIPEGYEIIDVEIANQYAGQGSRGRGFVYFLVNTEKVRVHATYNSRNNEVYYSNPGEVLEEEHNLS